MAIDRGVYAADGSFRVTVVDGTTYVGTYAPDGSLNVKVRSDETGYYDQSGAMLVTVKSVASASLYTNNGSIYVSTSPYVHGSVRVTVVSGSLSGGGSAMTNPPYGLMGLYFG